MISLDELQKKLETSWPNDMGGMLDYNREMSGYYAYLSGLLPQAQADLIRKKAQFVAEHKDLKGLKQYEYKDVLESYAIEELTKLNHIETLLKTVSKHLTGIITAISAEKTIANLGGIQT